MSEENTIINKTCRTVFPMGFGINKTKDDIYILDFIDVSQSQNNIEEMQIFSSYAFSEKKVRELITSLQEAIGDDE